MNTKKKVGNTILVVILTILSLLWIYPVFMILINSLKKESAISTGSVFKLPTAETFAGLENYINAIESKGFLNSLGYSLFITITSVAAILLFCSMCAWYISRVKGMLSQALYFLFAFSNLASSFFSVLKALITGIPVSISLDTRFNLSTSSCIFLNFGIATTNSNSTIISIAPSATPIIHAIGFCFKAMTLNSPPIPIIGA